MVERRRAVRLRVVYRRVHCPFGRNPYSDAFREKELVENGGWRERGETLDPRYRTSGPIASALTCEGPDQAAEEVFGPFTFLHNCYLDSSMPEHPCFGCKQAKKWRTSLGLRTFRVVTELTHVNTLGQPHQDHPMQVVYLPLNQEGTEWYAMNAFTGERKEVVRSVVEHRREDGTLITTTYPRRTPLGNDLEQDVDTLDREACDAQLKRGGMFNVPSHGPVWSGVESRTKWRCACATCTGQEQKMIKEKMSPQEVEDAVRALNVNAHGIRKSAHDYPSAPATPVTMNRKPTPEPKLAIAEMFKKDKTPAVGEVWRPEPGKNQVRVVPLDLSKKTPKKHAAEKLRRQSQGDDYVTPSQALSEGFRTMTDKPKTLALASSVKKTSATSATPPVKTKDGRRKK